MAWFTRRRILTIVGAVLLFLVGVGVGVGGEETVIETTTTTDTKTIVRTETDLVTTTVVKTVKTKPPAAPNARGISVSYGQWPGLFRLSGLSIASDFGYYSVVGTFEYLGGGDCDLGYLAFDASVIRDGRVIDTALWNDVDNPRRGVRYPFEMNLGQTRPDRVELVMTDASCS
jgi:hypothetical protein